MKTAAAEPFSIHSLPESNILQSSYKATKKRNFRTFLACCLFKFPSQRRSTKPPFFAISCLTRFAKSIAFSPYIFLIKTNLRILIYISYSHWRKIPDIYNQGPGSHHHQNVMDHGVTGTKIKVIFGQLRS